MRRAVQARAYDQYVSETALAVDHPLVDGRTADSPLVRAARGQSVSRTPVWFMRQAGRSLPEYRKVREGIAMLDSCFDADLITEITLQPVRRHGVDAAIFFSDIVVPLKAVGVDVDIKPGVGPVMGAPIRSHEDLAQLRDLTPDDVAPVLQAVRQLTHELGSTPLIGFAGAPFTLASYLVEGGPSRDHARTKAMMRSNPRLWHALCGRLSEIAGQFLVMQVENGASMVQLFDSWAGALSRRDYAEYVLPHSRAALEAVAGHGVPRIHFGVGTGEILDLMATAGSEVIGVDFRVTLADAEERIERLAGRRVPLQGNLDPALLFGSRDALFASAREVLHDARGLPGHIFNLGHGVLPDTDPDALTALVEFVHSAGAGGS